MSAHLSRGEAYTSLKGNCREGVTASRSWLLWLGAGDGGSGGPGGTPGCRVSLPAAWIRGTRHGSASFNFTTASGCAVVRPELQLYCKINSGWGGEGWGQGPSEPSWCRWRPTLTETDLSWRFCVLSWPDATGSSPCTSESQS